MQKTIQKAEEVKVTVIARRSKPDELRIIDEHAMTFD